MRKYKYLPTFLGMNLDIQRRSIPDHRLAGGKNIIFKEGRTMRRWGYTELGNNLPLSHGGLVGGRPTPVPITAVAWYDQLSAGVTKLVCFTTRDSYVYNTATGNWDYITKIYIDGQASCAGGTTVSGNLTTWQPAGVDIGASGDICAIKFGTQDPNAAGTPDNWYHIDTWTNDTSLELNENGPNTGGNVDYVIRLCWSGDEKDIHCVTIPNDSQGGPVFDHVLLVTNGVDDVQAYDAGITNDYCRALTDQPNKAKYISHYYGHTIIGNIDSGTPYPQTFEGSDIGKPEDWTGGSAFTYALADGDDPITWLETLQSKFMIYQTGSITEAWATGDSTNPMQYSERKIKEIGTPTGRTVVDMGDFHIFMSDTSIWYWNGISIVDIGVDINKYLFEDISPEQIDMAFAMPLRKEKLYCLFVPSRGSTYCDKIYVYNYEHKMWTYWEFDTTMTAAGTYKVDRSITWAELEAAGTTWEGLTGRWRDLMGTDLEEISVLGDSGGYLYSMDRTDNTDNDEPIQAVIETKDYKLTDEKYPDHKSAIRVYEAILGLTAQASGNITIQCSTDYGVTWSTLLNVDLTGDASYIERVCNFLMHGKHVRFRIANTVSGDNFEVESINVGYENVGVTIQR